MSSRVATNRSDARVATTRSNPRVASTKSTIVSRPLTVEGHRGLLYQTAHYYRRASKHLALQDLIQEGFIGLMRGLELFDPKRGAKPSVYLSFWIRAQVRRALCDQDREIRVPVHALEQKLRDGEPLPRPRSLDEPLRGDDEGPRTLHDVLSDEPSESPSPEGAAEQSEAVGQLRAALATLSARERLVLRERFGWRERTLLDVGAELGVTRERARQIEKQAVSKLRRALGPS